MKSIRTEIHIDAPPERVWPILTDFARYPAWNPLIPRAEGNVREGERLAVRIELPGGPGMTVRPTLTHVEPRRVLGWKGRLFVPKLFDGEHLFELHPADGGTRFVQREHFRGLLVPLVWGSLEAPTRQGFTAMNEALKREAEGSRAG